MKRTYKRDDETGKFILKQEWQEKYGADVRQTSSVHTMEAFKSPIDGSIISDGRQLREHNKRHGVTNTSDYSPNYIADRARARNKAGQDYLNTTRRSDINEAIHRHT